jgi:Spy/CpxP family protein refolding chaperone
MTFHRTFRTIAGVAAVAVAIGLGSAAALAQSPGAAHGPHGHYGRGGPDEMIGHLIAHAKSKLNLNTMQQGMFDTAVADSKAAREAGRAQHEKVKATLQAELAKAEPDLAAVAAAADAAVDQGRDKRKAIRAEWLALYATFTVEQKAVVKDLLQKRLAHAESFREKMREHMQSMFNKSSG